MTLQTEFPFTLPKGFVDYEGNVHREGTMRLSTAQDEIAPLRDPRVKQNPAYLVIILLSRVITKLGTLNDVSTAIVENMFSTDLAYLQGFYQRINSDDANITKVACPNCGTEVEVNISEVGG
ncbi:MAG: hypothetical protein JWO59_1034 [Chloroflexi bacterium]|nr:hypothetical protein [Chloroflexota bacterium]MDB5074284.1 hypothetical protein [Chloroflexota bacterium]